MADKIYKLDGQQITGNVRIGDTDYQREAVPMLFETLTQEQRDFLGLTAESAQAVETVE